MAASAVARAVSYDVYVGTSTANMTLAANVPAQMVVNPPATYSWTPPAPLQGGTTYFWKIVSRTNATALAPLMIATSSVGSFTTAGTTGPPAAPANPSPANGATGISQSPTLGWSAGAAGVTFNVAFGTANPPPAAVTGLTSSSFAPGALAPGTTYFWKVTAVSSGGSTAAAVWSFTTGSGGGTPEVVIYASDVTAANRHGAWTLAADATAAGGQKLSNPDAAAATIDPALAAPANFFDVAFQADAHTRYRVWVRLRAIANSKLNDSVFLQFSDSTNAGGTPLYRTGTTSGLLVNLATDAGAASVLNWGWQRNAYWLTDTGDVWFENDGTHTLRVQIREDGVEIDQIVISSSTYATNAPGSVTDDHTIVPKPGQPPACQDAVTLGYASGTLNIGFTLQTPVAANWSVWLVAQNTAHTLWSVPVPVIVPSTSFTVPIPSFPHLGTVYVATTLGPGTTATCWDVKSIDTGN